MFVHLSIDQLKSKKTKTLAATVAVSVAVGVAVGVAVVVAVTIDAVVVVVVVFVAPWFCDLPPATVSNKNYCCCCFTISSSCW